MDMKKKAIRELYFMQQCYASLFSVSSKIQSCGDENFETITSRQYMALIAIAHLSNENTTLNNIAKKLETTKQTASKLIAGLEKRSLVKTVSSEKDKRAINVEITSDGNKALIDNAEKSMYFLLDLFHEFNGEEIELFWNMLQKLYRFDGNAQDGFEEDAQIHAGDKQTEMEENMLRELIRRRGKK